MASNFLEYPYHLLILYMSDTSNIYLREYFSRTAIYTIYHTTVQHTMPQLRRCTYLVAVKVEHGARPWMLHLYSLCLMADDGQTSYASGSVCCADAPVMYTADLIGKTTNQRDGCPQR